MSGTSDVCAVAQVAQLATTTCATNFVLSVSGTICKTSAKDIIYIISPALVVEKSLALVVLVPLTSFCQLVAQFAQLALKI